MVFDWLASFCVIKVLGFTPISRMVYMAAIDIWERVLSDVTQMVVTRGCLVFL